MIQDSPKFREKFRSYILSWGGRATGSHTTEILNSSLFENSLFLLLTTISTAGAGLLFWILSAKLYIPTDIGVATTAISLMGLIVLITRSGFDQSLVKFLPTYKHSTSIFGTSNLITSILSIALGIICFFGIGIWLPELNIIKDHIYLFLIFLITYSTVNLTGTFFIAIRESKYYFYQNLVIGSRVLLLFLLVPFGCLGLYCAFGASLIMAFLYSRTLLKKYHVKYLSFDKEYLNTSIPFSAGSYISNLLITAPIYILPMMVYNILGAEKSAQFYIIFALAQFFQIIPATLSMSLFVEGCHGKSLKSNTRQSLSLILLLLTPIVIISILFIDIFLSFIGDTYLEASLLFKLMALSSFFIAIFQTYISVMKVKKQLKNLIITSALLFSVLIGSSYLLMIQGGINGIGYAWLLTYSTITALIITIEWLKPNLLTLQGCAFVECLKGISNSLLK